jgi:hypothetical protein
MAQHELFSVDEVGERTLLPSAVKPGKLRATPAKPGTGPEGETCKTCKHYCRVHYHDKVYLKCGLMRAEWSHGPGTDIKASYPACKEWAKPDAAAT